MDVPEQVTGVYWGGKPVETLTYLEVKHALINCRIQPPSSFKIKLIKELRSMQAMYENMKNV